MLAVKHGLSRKAALQAITIYAAENTGIADRVGSIRKGKDADFVLVSGDVLSIDTKVTAVYIDGKQVV